MLLVIKGGLYDTLVKCTQDSAATSYNQARPVRVAIKSAHATLKGHYVQLNGEGLHSFQLRGGGQVGVQKFIGDLETFELIYDRWPDVVSFKSTAFDNVYLRADSGMPDAETNLPLVTAPFDSPSKVNAQYGCGDYEKFYLEPVGKQGMFRIMSMRRSAQDGFSAAAPTGSAWHAVGITSVGELLVTVRLFIWLSYENVWEWDIGED